MHFVHILNIFALFTFSGIALWYDCLKFIDHPWDSLNFFSKYFTVLREKINIYFVSFHNVKKKSTDKILSQPSSEKLPCA